MMERVWASRLRWRLRGAWLAPLLVVLTVADALLLHARPLAGDGTDLFGALLLAGFFNLLAVAVVAPFAGMALRRLRPDLPTVVARDYAGGALVALVTAVLLSVGLVHHGTVMRNRHALAEAQTRGQAWIGTHAPAEYRRHVLLADVVAIVAGKVFRVCTPGQHPRRSYCVVVRLDRSFPNGVRFAGSESNAVFAAGTR
jgi:hypothetical protein